MPESLGDLLDLITGQWVWYVKLTSWPQSFAWLKVPLRGLEWIATSTAPDCLRAYAAGAGAGRFSGGIFLFSIFGQGFLTKDFPG